MIKQYLLLFIILLSAFTPLQSVNAESTSKIKNWYVTPEGYYL